MLSLADIDMSITGLHTHYQRGDFTPAQLVNTLLAHCRNASDNPVWLRLLTEQELAPQLQRLEGESPATLPLYGIPFAIKDNIDLAGITTTAACPAYAYTPEQSAPVVELLLTAGAIPVGKTNMDQFATGLVGTRSPAGACRNALNEAYISGGSSSGSALAVASGWVSFALGTDTAGSGRVPAALNNIVGLKPSRGLLSTRGVVPACRSLDCVSIFALSVADANRVMDVTAVFDEHDEYARPNPFANGPRYFAEASAPFTIGVPRPDQLAFFGDEQAARLYGQALAELESLGVQVQTIDFAPFAKAARLLYEGPWVAERYLVVKDLLASQPEALLPVFLEHIVAAGEAPSAAEAFSAFYELAEYRQQAQRQLAEVDCIVTPTIGTAYRRSELEAEPITLNSNLGYYTNFMNLLDYSAVALPTGFFDSGVGFGVTLFQQAFTDKRLLAIAAMLERHLALPRGATGRAYQSPTLSGREPQAAVNLVVCGAHLDGLPLNWQLRERGARLLAATTTAACYRLYALPGGPPYRPGLVRDPEGGGAIAVEVWRLPRSELGSFVAEIPPPLGIGQVELANGQWASGFICEPYGLEGAVDITGLGGWRRYLEEQAAS